MFKVLHPSLHVQELCPSRGQKDPWSKDILGMILIVAVVRLLSHVRLCNPMVCSTPGSPVLHHLPEFAQTHVH